jgi:hypothetical protein
MKCLCHLNRTALTASMPLLLTACATEGPKAALPTVMPGLNVMIDCADCKVDPQVSAAIRQTYDTSAAKHGVSIDPAKQATFTIKEYTQRGGGQRAVSILAGPLAFALKDEIKGVVSLGARREPIDYTYRNPFLGISSVAKKVGEMSFDALGRNLVPLTREGVAAP